MADVRAVSADEVRPLRAAVLRPGQPPQAVVYPGDADPLAFHGAVHDAAGRVIAAGTINPEGHPHGARPGDWRLRGMCAAPEARGRGLGAAVLEACLAHAAAHEGVRVWCNGRVAARSLYARAGFGIDGDPAPFDIEPIGPHHVLSRPLAPDPRPVEDLAALVARARELAGTGRRRLLGVAGPPGAGKSTVAAAIRRDVPRAAVISMDGFHLADALLVELGRRDRKGALDTFDAAGFAVLVARLRDPGPEPVYAPEFRRELEDSIAAALPVGPEVGLVVLEGNYLLVDREPWATVGRMLDEAWYVVVGEPERVERLVARHVRYGATDDEARRRARGSDEVNAMVVAATRHRAGRLVDMS